jgi:Holliday junction resolvase RusA-like endonuclease
MKITINYIPPNWNDYINAERSNFYKANKIKQQEKEIVKMSCIGKKYTDGYPIELTIRPHFKNKRQDLDNTRYKGLIDGLVASGVIENDNLTKIQRIILEPIFDNKEQFEIEIKKY